MPFEIVRNDITKMDVDAIVNAANSSLAPGGGVCGAIFAAAGYQKLEEACRKIGHCDVGRAVLTKGFALPARYVIHAVGPIWRGGRQSEAELLKSCYFTSLQLARKSGCKSIAFPLISAGIYGYPKAEALQIAVQTIKEYLMEEEMQVYLVIFDRDVTVLSKGLQDKIQSYIDDNYVEEYRFTDRGRTEKFVQYKQIKEQIGEGFNLPHAAVPPSTPLSMPMAQKAQKRSLDELLGNLEESFSQMLLRLIDEKGMTDVEVYKRANMDRKLFSKVRKSDYNPSKPTAIALAIALRLNLDETKDLLSKGGYALSHSNKFDVIIEYFIVEGIYDIYEINEALFSFDQKLLGA